MRWPAGHTDRKAVVHLAGRGPCAWTGHEKRTELRHTRPTAERWRGCGQLERNVPANLKSGKDVWP